MSAIRYNGKNVKTPLLPNHGGHEARTRPCYELRSRRDADERGGGRKGNRVSFFSGRFSFAALTPVGFGSRRLRLRDRVGDSACLF